MKSYKDRRRNIYIDCGANEGIISWKFAIDGNEDFEYFLFEPLPIFSDVGERMKGQFPNTKINFSTEAVWIKDEELYFYEASKGRQGSSLLKNKFSNVMIHDNPHIVNAIDFSAWILKNFSKDDYIICKMDIEGAEYDIVPKMIEDGSVEYIDEMIVEFHTTDQLEPDPIKGDYVNDRNAQIHEYFEQSKVKLTEWW